MCVGTWAGRGGAGDRQAPVSAGIVHAAGAIVAVSRTAAVMDGANVNATWPDCRRSDNAQHVAASGACREAAPMERTEESEPCDGQSLPGAQHAVGATSVVGPAWQIAPRCTDIKPSTASADATRWNDRTDQGWVGRVARVNCFDSPAGIESSIAAGRSWARRTWIR